MTYWNEISDTHIKFWDTKDVTYYTRIKGEITSEGYRGDKLQPSRVIFVGTCDIMSPLNKEDIWINMVHDELYSDQPLIALGTLSSGLSSMIRRLYAYIQNFGAPQVIYLTIPRFDSYEFVNKSGKCYSVSTRSGTADFSRTNNMINDEEHITWMKQLDAIKSLSNKENNKYIIEERFAFLETLCRLHNITLKWSFNPSDAGIKMLHLNVESFRDISSFMKQSFVGLPLAKDHLPNRTIGPETQREIYKKFIGTDVWDYKELCKIAEINFEWADHRYQKKIISEEDS